MATLLRTIVIDSNDESRLKLQELMGGTRTVLVGEFRDATEALRTAPSYRPDLVILEIPIEQSRHGAAAAATIEHLARLLPSAAIIVTGPIQSASLVIQVMRAGAVDFVARPVKQEDLAAAVAKVARSRTGSDAERIGKVISIYSPKGGAGVTTIAVNLAVCCARGSGRTVLV